MVPTVQAYSGTLPVDQGGIDFDTAIDPQPTGSPFEARWYLGRTPGVQERMDTAGEQFASIAAVVRIYPNASDGTPTCWTWGQDEVKAEASSLIIDEVAKYRRYDENGAVPGDYARMFEEEYADAVANLPELDATDEDWFAYVKRDAAAAVHDGYFSIDKAGRLTDPSVNARGEEKGEAKDALSYDLILKDKGRLLSLAEPKRFIFSHSALREGYSTDFDTDRIVSAAIRRLDQDLKVDRQVMGAELKTNIGVEDLRAGTGFQEEKARFQHEQAAVSTTVRYDIVGELAGLTRLTRGTVGRILKGIR